MEIVNSYNCCLCAQEGLEVPSTPKKLLGSLLEGKSEAARLEEELMTSR
jgi:hypothetical protein